MSKTNSPGAEEGDRASNGSLWLITTTIDDLFELPRGRREEETV